MNLEQYFYDAGKTSKLNVGGTLLSTGRYPIESWKQWNSLSDLKSFIIYSGNDAAAYPGMVVSVINDVNESNNGVYLVRLVGNDAKKLNSNECDDKSYIKLASISNVSDSYIKIEKDGKPATEIKADGNTYVLKQGSSNIASLNIDVSDKDIVLERDGEIVTEVKADGNTYVLKQGSSNIASFNITKDSFVKKGEIVFKQSDGSYSNIKNNDPYIHLIINTFDYDSSDDDAIDDIYISVKDMIGFGSFASDNNEMVDGIAKVSDVQNVIDKNVTEIKNIIEDNEDKMSEVINNLDNKIDESSKYISKAGPNWVTSSVGGIKGNLNRESFEGKTISEILDMLLYPTIGSSKTDPSITLVYNGTKKRILEVGDTLPSMSEFTFISDRGTLSFKNSNGDYFYGGTFGEITYTLNGIDSDGGYVITSIGHNIYTVSAYCNPGYTPLDNKGDVDSSLTAYPGGILTSSIDFISVYPLYANNSTISNMSKLPLKDYYSGDISYNLTIPPEVINGDKFMLEIPSHCQLFNIKQKNMTTNQYSIDVDMIFDGTINKNGIIYNKYIRTKDGVDTLGTSEYLIEINYIGVSGYSRTMFKTNDLL